MIDSSRSERPDLFARWVLVLWTLVVVAVGVRVLVLQPGARSLFPVFRQAGQDWAERHDLYPETVQGPNFPLFRYSPAVAAAFTPFALVDTKPGDLVWRALNTGALVGGLYWALRRLPRPPLTVRQLAVVFALMVPPALGHLSNGQCNAMVIGLVLAAYAAAAERRWNLAAAGLAVATLLKLYPVAPALLLATLHPRQIGPRYAVALAIGFALPFALGEPDYVARQYDLWIRYIWAEDRSAWAIENTNVDVQLLARVWASPMGIGTYRAVEVAAGLAFAAVTLAAARRWGSPDRAALLALGLGAVWMTAFGPATESPTYLLLAPSTCLAVATTWARYPRDPALRWLTVIAYALPLSVQVTAWYQPVFYAYRTLGPQPVAGLLLAVGLVWEDRRAREAAARVARGRAVEQESRWIAWTPGPRPQDPNALTSLVIPVYNPGAEIERTWHAVTRFVHSLDEPWEAIFVCDGCTDGTLERLRDLAGVGGGPVRVLGYPTNRGKGYAVRTGLAAARGRWLLFTDADLAYSPEDVVRVAGRLRAGAPVAVACREHPASEVVLPPGLLGYVRRRRIQSRAYAWLARMLLGFPCRDPQAGLKGMEVAVARAILPRLGRSGFGFDCEFLAACDRFGVPVTEVPVRVHYRDRRTTTSWGSALRTMGELFRTRREWTGSNEPPGPATEARAA